MFAYISCTILTLYYLASIYQHLIPPNSFPHHQCWLLNPSEYLSLDMYFTHDTIELQNGIDFSVVLGARAIIVVR